LLGSVPGIFRQGQKDGQFNIDALSKALLVAATPSVQAANPSPALLEAFKTLKILRGSDGFDGEKMVLIVRKILREPVAQVCMYICVCKNTNLWMCSSTGVYVYICL
jgi:hypothetical protein